MCKIVLAGNSPYILAGISHLLSRRTSRRFIGGRILVEVEIKLTFLLSKVHKL